MMPKPKMRRPGVTQDAFIAVRVDHRLRNSFQDACARNGKTAAGVLRTMMAAYVHKTLG